MRSLIPIVTVEIIFSIQQMKGKISGILFGYEFNQHEKDHLRCLTVSQNDTLIYLAVVPWVSFSQGAHLTRDQMRP